MKLKPFNLNPEILSCQTGRGRSAFSLVEVLVVISILSLIVLALMSVFSTTQRAFRASVTQTDVLQGGRSAVELITADLRTAAPCDGFAPVPNNATPLLSGAFSGQSGNGVNFFVTNNGAFYIPLVQSLPGSSAMRTNLLQWFFVLGRNNTKWTGVGYIVDTASTTYVYPLYRYYAETNTTISPNVLFNNFVAEVNQGESGFTNMSHVVDGVVHLLVRSYNNNGILITTNSSPVNTWLSNQGPGAEVNLVMSSNAVPASVELEMAVLEDRALARVQSLGSPGQPVSPSSSQQWTYLQGLAGRLHLFRERVNIQNLDPSAYQ